MSANAVTTDARPHVPSAGAHRALTGRQKAAIIVRLILAQGQRLSLASLPEPMQVALAEQMVELRGIDAATMQGVIEEFEAAIDAAGLDFPARIEDTLALLGDTISPEIAARMRRDAGMNAVADPWVRIAELDATAVAAALAEESIEVAAVVLSKLKVSKAAELLGLMPGDRARRIAYAVSLIGEAAPELVSRIGHTLAEQLGAKPEQAFAAGPVERIGAILNFSPSATREDVLAALDETDSGFAEEVRRAIFTFANIPTRVDPRDVPRIARDVPPDVLVTALAAATAEDTAKTAEFILSNMSQRMAGQLREDIEARGTVKEKDGEAAMTAVVGVIRELVEAGELLLVAEDD